MCVFECQGFFYKLYLMQFILNKTYSEDSLTNQNLPQVSNLREVLASI